LERVPEGTVTDRSEPDDDNGAIGIFPSWPWLYAAIIVYTVIAIVLLHVFTVTLDFGPR
jgi:hypothetical protein